MATALEPLLSVSDVARLLACSKGSVYALLRAGKLTPINIGTGDQRSRIRIRQSDLAAFIDGEETT